jgi:hypothetical protein
MLWEVFSIGGCVLEPLCDLFDGCFDQAADFSPSSANRKGVVGGIEGLVGGAEGDPANFESSFLIVDQHGVVAGTAFAVSTSVFRSALHVFEYATFFACQEVKRDGWDDRLQRSQ